ncbi:hypothetical protein H0G86_007433 [Trichoderma simmonsii]|uniref:Uncharacterized protein n=1 Tax=Trichoderma simmonsii TaxID=1491479 RepID=A0A8G0LDZ0_9HYPO|nr:hypothetical protein H0G86_007433 [Trichoderma simmonsii]
MAKLLQLPSSSHTLSLSLSNILLDHSLKKRKDFPIHRSTVQKPALAPPSMGAFLQSQRPEWRMTRCKGRRRRLLDGFFSVFYSTGRCLAPFVLDSRPAILEKRW